MKSVIKEKVIELKKSNPSYTLKDIKSRLDLRCSLATISNYLKDSNLGFEDNSSLSLFIGKSKTSTFSHLLISIRKIDELKIKGRSSINYLFIVVDLHTKLSFLGFSSEKVNETITTFLADLFKHLDNNNLKPKAIITSKNRVFQSDSHNKLNSFKRFLDSRDCLKHIVVSNDDRKVEQFTNKIFQQIQFNKRIFNDSVDLKGYLYSILYGINRSIIDQKLVRINKNYISTLLTYTPFYSDENLININHFIDSNRSDLIGDRDRVVSKSVDYLIEKADKEPIIARLEILNLAQDILRGEESNYSLESFLHIKIGMIHFQQGDGAKCRKQYKKALELAKRSGDKVQIGNASYFYGDQLMQNGKRKEAQKLFQTALDIFEESGDKRRASIVLGLFSTLFNNLKQYSKGLDYSKKMLQYVEEVDDKIQISIAYNKVANCYRNMSMLEEALSIYNERLEYAKNIGDLYLSSVCYGNISNIYVDQKKYDQALDSLELLFIDAEKIGHKILLAKSLSSQGNILYLKKDYDKSIKSYKRALEIFENLKIRGEIFNCYLKLGDLHKFKRNKMVVKSYYQKGIDIANVIGDQNMISKASDKMKNRSDI